MNFIKEPVNKKSVAKLVAIWLSIFVCAGIWIFSNIALAAATLTEKEARVTVAKSNIYIVLQSRAAAMDNFIDSIVPIFPEQADKLKIYQASLTSESAVSNVAPAISSLLDKEYLSRDKIYEEILVLDSQVQSAKDTYNLAVIDYNKYTAGFNSIFLSLSKQPVKYFELLNYDIQGRQ